MKVKELEEERVGHERLEQICVVKKIDENMWKLGKNMW